MRTNTLFQLALLLALAAGCTSQHADATNASTSPSASPAPLFSCEHRELVIDGVDMTIDANVDSSVGAIQILQASSDAARARALQDAAHIFGPVVLDTRRISTATKWGFPHITDPCGRPLEATPLPTSTPG